METPFSLRSKQLKELYECVSMRYVTRDERLDVLLALKHTVGEHDCALTKEMVALVDREADLLLRDVEPENLEGTLLPTLHTLPFANIFTLCYSISVYWIEIETDLVFMDYG